MYVCFMKVKLTKDQIDLLRNSGTVIDSTDEYIHLPFWFVSTDEEDVFDMIRFEKLPSEVVEIINDIRGMKVTITNRKGIRLTKAVTGIGFMEDDLLVKTVAEHYGKDPNEYFLLAKEKCKK